MLNFLPWLLSDKERPEYALQKAQFSHEGLDWEVGATAWCATPPPGGRVGRQQLASVAQLRA
jgi:hypothetical protein